MIKKRPARRIIDKVKIIEPIKTIKRCQPTDNTFLYVFYNPITTLFKIGISKDDAIRRRQIIASSGCAIHTVISYMPMRVFSPCSKTIEQDLHVSFKEKRFRKTEWFSLNMSDIIKIIEYLQYLDFDYLKYNKDFINKENPKLEDFPFSLV